MKLKEKIENIPLGDSIEVIQQKKYLVTRNNFNKGRSTKVFAQEIGTKNFISFNYYLTTNGEQLKPCEMAEQKVIDFLANY